ncbi:MAG TPA: hypothetical protein VFA78_07205 [Chloroflexota bacterium]|nr:hypothetical protein [Chloroflexota bacterium]
MRFRILLSVAMLVAGSGVMTTGLVGGPTIASADPTYAPICGSDEATTATALSGNYYNLTVHGNAYVDNDATLTVTGNLDVAPGACLDAFSMGTVHVRGNVRVGKGATLALGCAPGSNGPPPMEPCETSDGVPASADDTVGSNIIANQPLTMYLTAVTVGGNVISTGGGFSTPGLNFPIKNMNITGSLVVRDWQGGQGAWFGVLRSQVGGNMILTGDSGFRPGDGGIPNDSTEVVGNTVGGNLICWGNTPAALYGDAYGTPGNGPNTVGGTAIGECADLTIPLPS